MQREHLKSRLGFILLSAGCAIGIGNVWKFPYMVGQNGGGAFVLIYLFFLVVLGIPVMTMEFAVGRASQKGITKMYQEIEPKGTKWHIHGYAALIGNVILMMFYTVVSGWMLRYFVDMVSGKLVGIAPQFSPLGESAISNIAQMGSEAGTTSNFFSAHFEGMQSEPVGLIIFTVITAIIGFGVCAIGVQKGLEKVTKIMMVALLFIMVGLAIYGFTLEGAADGLKFYLVPNLDNMKEVGVFNVIVGAMNQSFFTLSLGIGSMAIFGSYIGRDRSLLGESVNIAVLDTFVAITSGLIIFPACFTFGKEASAGPPLIFKTLPEIFNSFDSPVLGRIIGSFFFLFLTFAAFSTVLAVFENIIAGIMELFNWSRIKTCTIGCIAMIILCLPCILGFNVLNNVTFPPLGEGKNIMDLEDFIVSNILLPLGSLTFVLFCTLKHRSAWGWDNFINEANQGKGLKVKKWMCVYMRYILPVIILVLFVIGVIPVFENIIKLINPDTMTA